jgi:hypothetical protein
MKPVCQGQFARQPKISFTLVRPVVTMTDVHAFETG